MNPVKDYFDSIAPNWDSCQPDKNKIITSLIDKIGIKKGDAILDLACGTGTITGILHGFSEANVYGLDLSPKMIEIAKEKYVGQDWAYFEAGDFLTWENEMKFDVIVLYNAYPHFKDPSLLGECLFKHLNEGGKFAIIHSLGRKELDLHHANVPHEVSRSLSSPKEEAKCFENNFTVFMQEEGEHFYLLAGTKSSSNN